MRSRCQLGRTELKNITGEMASEAGGFTARSPIYPAGERTHILNGSHFTLNSVAAR